ncbi:MAG: hypothetical protein MUF21_06345 [Gemmatimonadaceae bacterium]|nr:hypothetical protein [Gemmatimonadaceae bacterium]
MIGGTIGLVGNVTGGAVSAVSQAAGSVASRPDVDTDVLAQARQRIEDEARARGLTEEQVQAEVARVQQQAANVADRAQDTAAGSAWLALLALGLSLGAAVFGAMRGARDHVTIDPDIAAARAGYSSGHAHTTT